MFLAEPIESTPKISVIHWCDGFDAALSRLNQFIPAYAPEQ